MPEKCARCWSGRGLVAREVTADERVDPSIRVQKIVLCRSCADHAPEDPLLFWEVFLRFSSMKEFLSHYTASTEEEALRKLCTEKGFNEREVLRRARLLVRDAEDRPARRFSSFLNYASPYGYTYIDGALSVKEDEARVVGLIFRRYVEGRGIAKICQELNRLGYRTKNGRAWASQTVANILSNPVYCGLLRTNIGVRAGAHQRLIDAETFNRVQLEMERRIRRPDQKGEDRFQIRIEEFAGPTIG